MKIELKNIGTVKHAEIDLDKNLLIFCGPNNSGKTYAAYTLYGLHNNQIEIDKKNDLIEDIIKSTFKEGEMVFSFEKNIVKTILKEKETESSNNLSNVFATNQEFFSSSIISINVSDEDIKSKIRELTLQIRFSASFYDCTITKLPGSDIASINTVKKIWELGAVPQDDLHYFHIASVIKGFILRAFFKSAYVAPVERIGINIFGKELSLKRSGLLDPFSENDLKLKDRYSLPIMVSLRISQDLSNLERNRSDFYFLAEQIEEEILNGKITVSKNGDMQFNPKNANIKSLDISLSGSMVNALSSLVFYFRRLANKGDFIIIDEPELNLHPDNQITMARILGRIVNAGFKVLISTHSDYIITEINNLIRLKSTEDYAKPLMDKYGYSQADLIDRDTVGVYLFKDSKAIDVIVDEFGFEISTIQKENSRLAEISESIYFDLFDKEN